MEQELICRTCLSNTSKSISIYAMPSYCGKTFTISKMIMACAPVEISEGDGLPTKICYNCLKHLQVSFLFRIRTLQANEKLNDYLQTKLNPNLQPVHEGFIEPLVLPSMLDEEINQLFSWDQENESDPLFVDPLAKTDLKIEPKNEILPMEEVMLPTDMNYSAENTDECAMLTDERAMLTKTENESLISDSNRNLSNQTPLMYNWTNNSINEQQNPSNLENTEYNSNLLHLTETDTNILQSLLQNMQYNQNMTNAKFIIVKTSELTTLSEANNKQIEPATNVTKEHICEKNTVLPSTSRSNLQSSTSNKNDNLSNNTSLKINYKKPEKRSFEDELKKFVENRQQYMQRPNGSFCSTLPGQANVNRVGQISRYNAGKTFTKQKNNSKPPLSPNINLTSDYNTPPSLVPIAPAKITKNLDRSQHNSNDSTVPTFLNSIRFRKEDNKIIRLMIEEDQSSCIIIDD